MTAPAIPRSLELSVSNFGPIAAGRIELRPLTVFVGPSNTGKSYLATLIYALHGFCRDYSIGSSHLFGRRFDIRPPLPLPVTSLVPSVDDIARLQNWVGKMSVRDEVGINTFPGRVCPPPMSAATNAVPTVHGIPHRRQANERRADDYLDAGSRRRAGCNGGRQGNAPGNLQVTFRLPATVAAGTVGSFSYPVQCGTVEHSVSHSASPGRGSSKGSPLLSAADLRSSQASQARFAAA